MRSWISTPPRLRSANIRCSYVNSSARQRQSSSRRRIAADGQQLTSGLCVAQLPPDDPRQVPLQAAQRLAGALALGPLAGHEGLRRLVHAQLGEGDAVQGGVQLAVAAAVQAVAVALAARDRQGCDAGVHGEARRAGEALGPGRLADEAGGAEGAAARQGEEFGGELLGEHGDLAPQAGDLGGERTAAGHAFTGDARLDAQSRIARELVARCRTLSAEISGLGREIAVLTEELAPELLALPGCGALSAASLVGETAGAERFASAARFAMHAGVAPLPVSSGQSNRHRLNRRGNRQLNAALHRIALTQLRMHEPAQAFVARKRAEGKSTREALRCLKRHLARIVWRELRNAEARRELLPVCGDPPERAALPLAS